MSVRWNVIYRTPSGQQMEVVVDTNEDDRYAAQTQAIAAIIRNTRIESIVKSAQQPQPQEA